MEKLRAAVVGAGNIARTVHLPGYAQAEGCEAVALCDTNKEAVQQTAAQFGIKNVYGSHTEMLKAEKPDIVSVCTPNALHHDIVVDCLRAGSHVLCEKPPATTYAEALDMHEEALRAKRTLGYNFCRRFCGEAESLSSLVQQGGLGSVYVAEAKALRRRAVPGWGVFTSKAMQGGGALIDLGVHMLDLGLWLMGNPEPSYAAAGSFDLIGKQGGEGMFGPWQGGDAFTVEDGLFGFIRFKNGAVLSLQTSFTLHNAQRETTHMDVALYGDKAGANLYPCVLHTNREGVLVDESIPFANKNFQLACVPDFVAAVQNGTQPRAGSESALPTQRLVDALYQSSEQNKPVVF